MYVCSHLYLLEKFKQLFHHKPVNKELYSLAVITPDIDEFLRRLPSLAGLYSDTKTFKERDYRIHNDAVEMVNLLYDKEFLYKYNTHNYQDIQDLKAMSLHKFQDDLVHRFIDDSMKELQPDISNILAREAHPDDVHSAIEMYIEQKIIEKDSGITFADEPIGRASSETEKPRLLQRIKEKQARVRAKSKLIKGLRSSLKSATPQLETIAYFMTDFYQEKGYKLNPKLLHRAMCVALPFAMRMVSCQDYLVHLSDYNRFNVDFESPKLSHQWTEMLLEFIPVDKMPFVVTCLSYFVREKYGQSIVVAPKDSSFAVSMDRFIDVLCNSPEDLVQQYLNNKNNLQ